MSKERIQQALQKVAQHFAAHPQDAASEDTAAVTVLDGGLRCRTQGPGGAQLVSDMPRSVGGGGAAPSPGWLLRAALGSCDATLIAMRAAQLGIDIRHLEVAVHSRSDDRGVLGLDDGVPPGPLALRVHIRIAADGASPAQLHELIDWAERHSPVGDAVRRAVPCSTEIEVL